METVDVLQVRPNQDAPSRLALPDLIDLLSAKTYEVEEVIQQMRDEAR